jgi:cytochrome c oxidase subunit 2
MPWLPIYPPQASSISTEVDALVLFMLLVSLLIAVTVFVFIVVFCVKYRRGPGNDVGVPARHTTPIEITWTLVPMVVALIPFIWGAKIYLEEAQPPADALEVFVVAKQWMWKAELPGGQSEIGTLHVPVGRAVRLTMTSQDVIHSFYVPAFRVKADVLPGRYTTLWFQATQPGEYRLFCSQYCGTDHADMTGEVVVMTPGEYSAWLTGGATASNSPAARGRQLFLQNGCVNCHETGRAPNLQGVFGQPVLLSDGTKVIADENYVRESILSPAAKVVNGYQPIMPSFAGRLGEDELADLIAYIQSIGAGPGAGPAPPPALQPVPGPSPSPVPAGGRGP